MYRQTSTILRFVDFSITSTRRFTNTTIRKLCEQPPPVLRDYQVEALESVKNAIARGIKRPAVVMATGGGKTVVFSQLIPQLIKRDETIRRKTLVLAHKEELVYQAATSIALANPSLNVEIDMRNFKSTDDADVVVGSVPTLIRVARLERYNPELFQTIILDECHHASAKSWLKILNHFGALEPDAPINVIGFTATLERNDGKNLGDIFDEVVFQRSLIDMVKNNELVDVKFTCIKTEADLAKVRVKGGDYESNSLSEVINTSETNLLVAYSYKKLKEKFNFRTTLVFCVDIQHCKTLCGVLQRNGINAQYVTGETSKRERADIVQDFKDGKINVLCNVQVFTEGTDVPNIDSLFLVRPTKSRSLLVQMIGRGLRLHGDKTHCHVVDIVGARGTGIQSVPTLFSLPPDHQIEGKTFKQLEIEKNKIEEDELEQKRLEAIEKEKQRRLEEEVLHRKLERLSLWENGDEELFDTFDGFSSLDVHDEQVYQVNKTVCEEIRKSFMPWARLEFDLWGCSVDHRFVLIRRSDAGDGKSQFSLCMNSFVPLAVRKSNDFKVRKFGEEQVLETHANLKAILTKAENHFRAMMERNYLNDKNRRITKGQSLYLKKALVKRAKQKYEFQHSMEQKISAAIDAMSFFEASPLIFSLTFSPASLHAKWALQKILGLDNKGQAEVASTKKKLKRHLARVESAATPAVPY